MKFVFLILFVFVLSLTVVSAVDLEINNFGFRTFDSSNQEYTPYLSVVLFINYTTGAYCRYCNDNVSTGNNHCVFASPSWSSWEICSDFRLWELQDFYGDNRQEYKYVFTQSDLDCLGVGCTAEEIANDSIYYDYSGIGLDLTPPVVPAVVSDVGNYTSINDSIFVSWSDAIDLESNHLNIPLTYKVRALENGTPITSWFDVGQSLSVTLNLPYDMQMGLNYSVEVSAINSVGLFTNSTSDGIFYDPYLPVLNVSLSVYENNWTTSTQIFANLSAYDNLSGVKGFSYRLVSDAVFSPDSLIDSYGNFTTISFYLPSGIYYLHSIAIDNAGNLGLVSSNRIMIDNTPPTRPIFNSSILYSLNQMISWTASIDYHSGVQDYFIEVAIDPDFSTVVSSFWTSSNETSFDFSLINITGGLYYIRLKARDNLNQESLYSNQEDLMVDLRPPIMTLIRPKSGFLFSSRPSIAISTDEISNCYYRLETSVNYSVFSYTGSDYHEAYINELSGELGSYKIYVKCLDLANNPVEESFSISLRVDSDLSGIKIYPSENYGNSHLSDSVIISQYVNGVLELLLEVSPQVSGLSDFFEIYVVPIDIDEDEFIDYIKKNSISRDSENSDYSSSYFAHLFQNDYGIGDFGDGTYSLKFQVPSFPGKYELYVRALGVEKKIYFQVLPLTLSLRYVELDGDITNVSSMAQIVRYDFDNYTFGIASEKKPKFYFFSKEKSSISEPEVTDYDASLSADISSELFFFMTQKSEYFEQKDSMLVDGKFLDIKCPSFGYPPNIVNAINVIFTAEDIQLDSSEFFVPGKYTFYFENVGVNGLQKVVSVSSLNDFSLDPDEIKYTRYDVYG
ncbi:hypothetical protein JXM83_00995 [Candidatus Woesearchaeota archaeon]|nr:hypothetical protein [Candidatus Woesearchaeota archaeon]